jgi:hypothetical protein
MNQAMRVPRSEADLICHLRFRVWKSIAFSVLERLFSMKLEIGTHSVTSSGRPSCRLGDPSRPCNRIAKSKMLSFLVLIFKKICDMFVDFERTCFARCWENMYYAFRKLEQNWMAKTNEFLFLWGVFWMNFCRSRFSTRGNSIRFLKFFNRDESTYKLYLNSQLLLTRNKLFQKLLVKSYQIQHFFSFLQ